MKKLFVDILWLGWYLGRMDPTPGGRWPNHAKKVMDRLLNEKQLGAAHNKEFNGLFKHLIGKARLAK